MPRCLSASAWRAIWFFVGDADVGQAVSRQHRLADRPALRWRQGAGTVGDGGQLVTAGQPAAGQVDGAARQRPPSQALSWPCRVRSFRKRRWLSRAVDLVVEDDERPAVALVQQP